MYTEVHEHAPYNIRRNRIRVKETDLESFLSLSPPPKLRLKSNNKILTNVRKEKFTYGQPTPGALEAMLRAIKLSKLISSRKP
ncbi:hypothetical protein TWF225_009111 [Orbilia oligospora]|uniref:Uncharacterized protein n=1 Tax=Orbilia oligospora TaxID=2813651 RepID=A0A7C8P9U5_ORBOL|nr:hypothetical protein TWF751_009867 [Orbilia oligospora]KAF3175016.1 hypothetical protein TWF225_009111 [Orbilia oligospora]KAF3241136.1 hypothetical protein TWF128_011111 [Orbilia oligospora]KAF3271123.1 hypothetical protein TWF217_005541 [Orbilia oligospora]KAF3288144.1 hypothetical protein TWF132_007971 [Orbilia oligospora]